MEPKLFPLRKLKIRSLREAAKHSLKLTVASGSHLDQLREGSSPISYYLLS